jgi:hypothetical protein
MDFTLIKFIASLTKRFLSGEFTAYSRFIDMGANGIIENCLIQTAPRFAPRWRVQIPFGKAGIQA